MKVVINEFKNGQWLYSIGSVEECLEKVAVYDEEQSAEIDAEESLLGKMDLATCLTDWNEYEGWLFREDQLASFEPIRGIFGPVHLDLDETLPFEVPAKGTGWGGCMYKK